jgi:hypothetical protein
MDFPIGKSGFCVRKIDFPIGKSGFCVRKMVFTGGGGVFLRPARVRRAPLDLYDGHLGDVFGVIKRFFPRFGCVCQFNFSISQISNHHRAFFYLICTGKFSIDIVVLTSFYSFFSVISSPGAFFIMLE